jgi:ferredoxin
LKSLFHSITKSLGLTLNGPNGHNSGLEKMGRVVPDPNRCVQCGVCGYNCPVGIPVRDYAHRGLAVDDPSCITCGNCIQVCPRGTLRWETDNHRLVAGRFPIVTLPPAASDGSV